jgi:hypothetical protein
MTARPPEGKKFWTVISGILQQQGLPAPGAQTRHRFPHVPHGRFCTSSSSISLWLCL